MTGPAFTAGQICTCDTAFISILLIRQIKIDLGIEIQDIASNLYLYCFQNRDGTACVVAPS